MSRIVQAVRTAWQNLGEHLTEAQQDVLRVVGLIVLAAALAAGGYFWALPLYQHWQGRRAFTQAEHFAEAKDYRSLVLALRRAVEKSPNTLDTWQKAVQILDEIGSPMAVDAREQASLAAPGNLSLRLALVQEAVKFNRIDTAQSVLARLDAAAWKDAAFQRLAASVALATGDSEEFERRMATVVAASPNDLNARFTYSAARLWGADAGKAEAARGEMEALLAEPSTRIRASIELIADAAGRRDAMRVRQILVRMLGLYAAGTPPDFSSANPPAWNALLAGIRGEAAKSTASDIALTARWESDLGHRKEARQWLASLPDGVRGQAIVADTEAELAVADGDLVKAEELLRAGAWGPIPNDALVLAMASHIQPQYGDATRSRLNWNDAIRACRGNLSGLRVLSRLAGDWKETANLEQTLLIVVELDPKAFWAFNGLRNSFSKRHDLDNLFRLYGLLVRVLPQDRLIAEEWIELACLLNQAKPEINARAEEIYRDDPHAPEAALAYCASLWRQGRKAGAAAIAETIPQVDRSIPRFAFWLALIEADAGHLDVAGAALDAAYAQDRADAETVLLDAAARKIGYRAAASAH